MLANLCIILLTSSNVPVKFSQSFCLTLWLVLEAARGGRGQQKHCCNIYWRLADRTCLSISPKQLRLCSGSRPPVTNLAQQSIKEPSIKGPEESYWIITIHPNLIGFFQQPLEPGHLCLQLPDQLPTVVLVDCGAVHDVFSSARVTQGAQGLAGVRRRRRNGWECAQLYALVWERVFWWDRLIHRTYLQSW